MGMYGSTTKYLLDGVFDKLDTWSDRRKRVKAFETLAKKHGVSINAVRNSFNRAVRSGLIDIDETGEPHLTPKGQRVIAPFHSRELPGSVLMVIFDIPEDKRVKRDHLRRLLIELNFKQIQKSVWVSNRDSRQYLLAEINALDGKDDILLFESKQLKNN